MFISVENVSKSYAGNCVFRNFCFYAQKGASVAIMGENGVGKSTLLRLLAGRTTADFGTVNIGGESAEDSRRTVYLPQSYGMIAHKTVAENMIIPLTLLGFSRHDSHLIAKEHLRIFGLERFGGYYPCQLSGGVLRRAAIAETGLFSGDVLLLDEPTAGIGSENRDGIYRYLNSRRLSGATLIIATHDTRETEILTETTLLLRQNPVTSAAEAV